MNTPQNTPQSTNNEPLTPKDIRIPTIVEQRLKGQDWSQIAKDLQINRKTLYDIRQKNEYTGYLVEYLYPRALQIVQQDLEKEKDYPRINAYKEIFKMIKALIPKQIESKNLSVSLSLQEKRESNAWIEYMSPTEFNNFQDLKASACSRMERREI